jgi:hypothetical protein
VTTTLDFSLDGKRIGRAFWAAIGKSEMTIATSCHEMGHMLFNWPDLYNVPKGGLGAHCLMASYADDYDPVPPNEALQADKVFRFINPARSDESFFAVNRKHTDRYRSLGGRGLLIFHFDMDWNESEDETKASVMLVPDLGRIKPPADWFEPGWYFYANNMTEFSKTAQAGENAWHDGKTSGIRLFNISALSDTMSFSMGEPVASLHGPSLASGSENANAGHPLFEVFDIKGARTGSDSLRTMRAGKYFQAAGTLAR